LAFGDFNTNNRCQGFGLKVLSKVKKGDTICRMKTSMGMISDSIVDKMGVAEVDEVEEELH
jgi:hypothetical protein